MIKYITVLMALGVQVAHSSETFKERILLAGWDFASPSSISVATVNFPAERGTGAGAATLETTGRFGSTPMRQIGEPKPQVRFIGHGRKATAPQANANFDKSWTSFPPAVGNGQQCLAFLNFSEDFSFVLKLASLPELYSRHQLLVMFDWFNSVSTGAPLGDFLNISYSSDGVSWTAYKPNGANSLLAPETYFAFESTDRWASSNEKSAIHKMLNGQQNSNLVLPAKVNNQPITFIRFEVTAPETPKGMTCFDNLAVYLVK